MRVHLRDSNRQPQPSRENLEWYPLPSQKAWLEISSDNHSQIFTTLLPQNVFSLMFVYKACPIVREIYVYRERGRKKEREREVYE